MGHKFAFDASRLLDMYGSEKAYSGKVAQSVDRLVKDRWLTEGDARRVKADLTAAGAGASLFRASR
jgi:hypothetical protein